MRVLLTITEAAEALGVSPSHIKRLIAEATARRRYWREAAAVALLSGHRWPEAERLGGGA